MNFLIRLKLILFFACKVMTDDTIRTNNVLLSDLYLGVKLIEGVKVKEVISENGSVSRVETSLGSIKCQYFVNAAGQVSNSAITFC